MKVEEETVVRARWEEVAKISSARYYTWALGAEDAQMEGLFALVIAMRAFHPAYDLFSPYMERSLRRHLTEVSYQANQRLRVESRMSLDQPVKGSTTPVKNFSRVKPSRSRIPMSCRIFCPGWSRDCAGWPGSFQPDTPARSWKTASAFRRERWTTVSRACRSIGCVIQPNKVRYAGRPTRDSCQTRRIVR